MNCCVQDEHCREIDQPKEKDANKKLSVETKTFRRAAFLVRRASHSGAC